MQIREVFLSVTHDERKRQWYVIIQPDGGLATVVPVTSAVAMQIADAAVIEIVHSESIDETENF